MAKKPNLNEQMARVADLFEREDPEFVDALREIHSYEHLATFTDRWKTDVRSWARQQIANYLDLPMNQPGHQTVVKRLFKHAEEKRDDEIMALFLVTFDRMVRRKRKTRYQWDWQIRKSWSEESLITPRNAMPLHAVRAPQHFTRRFRLFSYHTRYYLRRRAWRYFRRLGHQRPDEYARVIARALVQYRDADLARGEDILENWGLINACFRHHESLDFTASRILVNVGFSLADLKAAPRYPEAWQAESSAELLLDILRRAQSRLVRLWSVDQLHTNHQPRLATIPIDQLIELLNHADAEVQQFGAELLENHQELDRLPVELWLRLLEVKNLTILETICQVMRKHVSAERLTLEECIQLACVEETSVARLGFEFLQSRKIETADDRFLLRKLGGAKCDAIETEVARWALAIVGADDDQLYNVEAVCYFFDSLLASIRNESWQWLVAPSSGYRDPVLWSRILETPFDDIRLRVIEELEKQAKLPGISDDDLTPVWSSVLLGVHRGGRQKAKAVRQIGDAIEQNPGRVNELLPVLVVAVRSIRQPEFRAGLAALVSTIIRRPKLVGAVRHHVPELELPKLDATTEETAG